MLGSFIGAEIGTAAGGVGGTFVCPVVGTIGGGVAGGIAGGTLGAATGAAAGELAYQGLNAIGDAIMQIKIKLPSGEVVDTNKNPHVGSKTGTKQSSPPPEPPKKSGWELVGELLDQILGGGS